LADRPVRAARRCRASRGAGHTRGRALARAGLRAREAAVDDAVITGRRTGIIGPAATIGGRPAHPSRTGGHLPLRRTAWSVGVLADLPILAADPLAERAPVGTAADVLGAAVTITTRIRPTAQLVAAAIGDGAAVLALGETGGGGTALGRAGA